MSLVLVLVLIWIYCYLGYSYSFLGQALGLLLFYVPNILQALLIVLKWPIKFYFVKACVFILVLSLTSNVSYFNVKDVPDDFLAASTTTVQWGNQNKMKAATQETIILNVISDFQKKYIDDVEETVA
ncbi:1299_t:CDS:2 [Diversispora eburnea]|uniref:1299_t:CDS:1 n=1 Tax=Diversispora eburnea TaxID=1213867 RepID=A0A9N9EYK3_9GLOM|nr:1299_t:CDS:2 [Diversispora eburnea]